MGTYINNKNLKKPNDDDKIWRYMDFTKLVSILHYKSLHFTRVDKFKDPYDASIASYFVEELDMSQSPIKKFVKTLHKDQPHRRQLFVNCWHINASESAALWKVYMKSDEGIAIQTTVRKLITVLEASNNDLSFDVASIEYDPSKLWSTTPSRNGRSDVASVISRVLFTKRHCFEYEHELRAFVRFEKRTSAGYDWPDLDINLLIESIYVNPEAPGWVVSLIRDLAKSYKITGKVHKSNIY